VCQWYDDDTRNCYGQSCRSPPPAHLPTAMMVVAQTQKVPLVQFPLFSRAQGAELAYKDWSTLDPSSSGFSLSFPVHKVLKELTRIDQPWIPPSPASPSLFPCTRCAERAYKDWSTLDPSFSGFSFSFTVHKVLSNLTRIDQPWIPSSPASPSWPAPS